MKRRRLGAAVTAAGMAAGAVAWMLGGAGPPLYDGLPIGTPPYRYLDPPAGSPRTPPPGSVNLVVHLADAPNGVVAQTNEPRPQVDAEVPTELLELPPGTTTVRVSLRPIRPPPVAPKDGTIDGNVYDLAVTTLAGQDLRMKPGVGLLFQIDMRGTGSAREPYVEQETGGQWFRVPFVHPEAGIFEFHPAQPGLFALVLPPGHSAFGPGVIAGIVIGGTLVALAAALALVRRRRPYGADGAETRPGGPDADSRGDDESGDDESGDE